LSDKNLQHTQYPILRGKSRDKAIKSIGFADKNEEAGHESEWMQGRDSE
jgi:hypothetical protein